MRLQLWRKRNLCTSYSHNPGAIFSPSYLEHVGLREAEVPLEVGVVEVDQGVRPVPEHARLPHREREEETCTGILRINLSQIA